MPSKEQKDDSNSRVQVKIVSRKGDSAVIEYTGQDMPERAVIAHSMISEDSVEASDLEQAAPYGVPLAKLLSTKELKLDPTRLQRICRERGLWTRNDFERNPTQLQAALLQELQVEVSVLIQLARDYDDGAIP